MKSETKNTADEAGTKNTADVATAVTTQPQERHSRRRGCSIGCLVLLVLTVGGLLFLGSRLLGPVHRYQVPAQPSEAEIKTQEGVMRKLTASLLDEQGRIREKVKIVLTEEEVNALLRAGLRRFQAQRRDKTPKYYLAAEWKNGAQEVKMSRPVFLNTAVNLDLVLTGEFANGQLTLHTQSCRVGKFTASPAMIDAALKKSLARLAQKPEHHMAAAFIQSARIRGCDLELILCPGKIAPLLPFLSNR